jgi:hypothetical protein
MITQRPYPLPATRRHKIHKPPSPQPGRLNAKLRMSTFWLVELRGLEPLASCMPCKSGGLPTRATVPSHLQIQCICVPMSTCISARVGCPLGYPLILDHSYSKPGTHLG